MKAPKNMRIYHKEVLRGEEIKIKKEPWMRAEYREDYLDYLDELLTLDSDVIEFGSGGSSLYIARKVRSLEVYESDEIWYKVMLEEIRKEYIANITIFLDPDYSKDLSGIKPRFDVAWVEVWNQPEFGKCLESAMKCLRPGGVLILMHNRVSGKLINKDWTVLKKWRRWKYVLRKP